MNKHSRPPRSSLLVCPATPSTSVPGSTLPRAITQRADNRHFIRTKVCQCRACRLTAVTPCDQMSIGAPRLEVADLSVETEGLHGCAPLSLQEFCFTVISLTNLTCRLFLALKEVRGKDPYVFMYPFTKVLVCIFTHTQVKHKYT